MEKYQVFPGQNYQANVIGFTGLQEVSVIHVYENTATVLIKETAETGVAKLCNFLVGTTQLVSWCSFINQSMGSHLPSNML